MLKDVSPRDWGAFVVSIVVLGFFAYLLWFSTTHGLPKDDASVQQIVGALIAALSGVLGYWIGSSKSSQAKDATNADQARALAHFAAPEKPAGGPPPAAALVIVIALAVAVLGHPGAARAQEIHDAKWRCDTSKHTLHLIRETADIWRPTSSETARTYDEAAASQEEVVKMFCGDVQ